MYKIDFPIDAKEAAVIARRRRAEEERKLRIFNPRERIFGVILILMQFDFQVYFFQVFNVVSFFYRKIWRRWKNRFKRNGIGSKGKRTLIKHGFERVKGNKQSLLNSSVVLKPYRPIIFIFVLQKNLTLKNVIGPETGVAGCSRVSEGVPTLRRSKGVWPQWQEKVRVCCQTSWWRCKEWASLNAKVNII